MVTVKNFDWMLWSMKNFNRSIVQTFVAVLSTKYLYTYSDEY
jgi:hypothetical protein